MGKKIVAYSSYEVSAAVASVADTTAMGLLFAPPSVTLHPLAMGLTRLEIILTTAVQTKVGLLIPATKGTVSGPGTNNGILVSSGGGGYGDNSGNVGTLATAWSVAPTFSGAPVYLRSAVLPAIIGASLVWEWPDDDPLVSVLVASSNLGLALRNITGGASAAVIINARWININPNLP